ncbi:MAG TPA: response regulator [Brevundimonas sp.]|jgi:CheY-like chemotaxis protein
MSSFNENLRESAVFNFNDAVTMVVDDSPFGLDLTAEALRGFGIQVRYSCISAADAINVLKDHTVDLLLIDCEMPGMDGHELVRWIRNSGLDPNAYVPIIMTAGHVRKSKVGAVRDCGANYLVTKPFSAASLLERLIWVARDTRPFLEVGDYRGPDRRQRDSDPRDYNERRSDMVALTEHKARALADANQNAEAV